MRMIADTYRALVARMAARVAARRRKRMMGWYSPWSRT